MPNETHNEQAELRTNLLRFLAEHHRLSWSDLEHRRPQDPLSRFVGPGLQRRDYDQALWGMLSEGLVFLETPESTGAGNWSWMLTERGVRCAQGQEFEPADPGSYLARLKTRAQDFGDPAEFYTREALQAFGAGCYPAAAVMIGLAAEAEFQTVGEASLAWFERDERATFEKKFGRVDLRYAEKLRAFRDLILKNKGRLPPDLRDSLESSLHTLADFLRISRNEAGHLTGRAIDRDDASALLTLFGFYAVRLEALRAFFKARPGS